MRHHCSRCGTSKHTGFVIERCTGRHPQRATVVGTVDLLRYFTEQTDIVRSSEAPLFVRSRMWLRRVSCALCAAD